MNPFGDDPDWASLDDDPFDGDDENEGGGGGRDPSNIGAQHIVLLIDCNDSMFDQYVPCLSDHIEDSEGGSSGEDDDHANDDGGKKKMSPTCTYVSPMDVAITAAHRYLRTKIRDVAETKSGKRDGVGVLLYGCDPYRAMGRGESKAKTTGGGMGKSNVGRIEGSDGEDDDEEEDDDDDDDDDLQPSTHELIELAAPGIEQILAIQECLPREHNSNRKRRNLQSEFSSERNITEKCKYNDDNSNVCSLLQGLTATLKVFGSAKCVKNPTPASKQLPDSKSVWIFTNQDDPCHGDEAKNTRIHMVTRDFQEAGVAIHVLPLPKKSSSGVGTSEFDHTIFYNRLASSDDYICDATDSNGIVDVEAILDRFDIGTKKRRKYASLPLLLPGWKERNGDTGIMIDLYGTVSIRSKPQKIPVHQENNRMTTRRTIRIIAESGEEVQPENLHHSANFCGSRVSLQPANVAMMKQASNSQDRASLVIHGFRPMTQFSATNLLSKTVLATPNDTRVNGSCRALYNLKQSMLKKNVFAVGELLVRASATSKMVAVVPKAGDGVEGFHIIHIPFKEDVRAVNEKDIGIAERSSVDAAKRLISKSVLHFDDFASYLPENPHLKHFFGYLESVSLGKALGPVEDDAKMDVQQMLENAGEEIESFSNCLPDNEQLLTTERKRKAHPPSLKQEFKKECVGQEWIELYENDEIATLKSDELKGFLKSQGERLAGKKADLVDRVRICIRKEVLKDM